ncbi:hypothetical protein HK101_003466 [Irineochytrium annulatum]|nr:hypothetical protein HK101_003466 [Irineochytrium annulatum]
MKGADIWLLLKYPNGSYYIQDSYSTDYTSPVADTQQDVTLLYPPPASNHSTLYVFQRATQTCDSQDNFVTQGMLSAMIWAYGNSSTSVKQHLPTNRDTVRLQLWADPNATVITPPSDLKNFSISMPNYTVPTGTSYRCTHFALNFTKKFHATEYQGLAKSKLVHHMIIYGCDAPATSNGDSYDCQSMEMACTHVVFIWAPGTPLFQYPAAAGMGVGNGTNSYNYFSLQVHYNNPTGVSGVVDNSGMWFSYTSVLRPNDVGILWLGEETISIPGNSPNATVLPGNWCPSDCTKLFPTNLTVFA